MVLSLLPSQNNSVLHERFFDRRWVRNALPLASSLLLHGVVVLVGILLYQAVQQVNNPNRDQPVIPAMGTISPAYLPKSGLHPSAIALPHVSEEISGGTPDEMTSTSPNKFSAGEPFTMAMGPNRTAGEVFSQRGTGAPWTGPGGPGLGVTLKIGGRSIGGNAQKVVYLCDASGSMLSVFSQLKQQLRESIQDLDLTRGQQFNVVFFSDDKFSALFSDGTQIATADNKKLAMDFIDNAIATGGTQPLPAIKFAMSEKPEMIYVLTDGFDQTANFDDVTNAFKAGNQDGRTHINCIFLQADEDPKLEAVLKQISGDGHGSFLKILKADM